MPTISVNQTELYYEVHGEGQETIVFSHGLLWSGKMFAPQVAHFSKNYRVVTYDHRGQGRSKEADSGYDMDNLYQDAVALIEALNLGKCHFAGLSMGGFVAMRLAARRPDLLKSVILMETSAEPEPNKFKYSLLNTIVKLFGVKPVTNSVMPIMFGKTFLQDPARAEEKTLWTKELQANKRSITKAVAGVVNRAGVLDEIGHISIPTLIMVGDEDVATIPAKAKNIQSQIPDSELHIIANAGHTSTIEAPDKVISIMESFLMKLK